MFEVGDTVTQMLAGTIPREMKIAAIDDQFIYCGPVPEEGASPRDYPGWKFDKNWGFEVDEVLGWGMQTSGPMDGDIVSGSYLVMPKKS